MGVGQRAQSRLTCHTPPLLGQRLVGQPNKNLAKPRSAERERSFHPANGSPPIPNGVCSRAWHEDAEPPQDPPLSFGAPWVPPSPPPPSRGRALLCRLPSAASPRPGGGRPHCCGVSRTEERGSCGGSVARPAARGHAEPSRGRRGRPGPPVGETGLEAPTGGSRCTRHASGLPARHRWASAWGWCH